MREYIQRSPCLVRPKNFDYFTAITNVQKYMQEPLNHCVTCPCQYENIGKLLHVYIITRNKLALVNGQYDSTAGCLYDFVGGFFIYDSERQFIVHSWIRLMQGVTSSTAKLIAVEKALCILNVNSCLNCVWHAETGVSEMILRPLNKKNIFIKENIPLISRIKQQISDQSAKTMTWISTRWMCKLPLVVKREWETYAIDVYKNN